MQTFIFGGDGDMLDALQLIGETWGDIGIKLIAKPQDRAILRHLHLDEQRQPFRQFAFRRGQRRHEAQAMRTRGVDQQAEVARPGDDLVH